MKSSSRSCIFHGKNSISDNYGVILYLAFEAGAECCSLKLGAVQKAALYFVLKYSSSAPLVGIS